MRQQFVCSSWDLVFAFGGVQRKAVWCRLSSRSARMVFTNFNGAGIGFGFGVGCGFGVGWGFGGMPLNFLGLGAGGGCGVGLGLGWGFGTAIGSKYRSSEVTFQGIEFTSKEQAEVKEPKDLPKSNLGIKASQ